MLLSLSSSRARCGPNLAVTISDRTPEHSTRLTNNIFLVRDFHITITLELSGIESKGWNLSSVSLPVISARQNTSKKRQFFRSTVVLFKTSGWSEKSAVTTISL